MDTRQFIDLSIAAIPLHLASGKFFAGKELFYGEFDPTEGVVEDAIARLRDALIEVGCICGPVRFQRIDADEQGPSLVKGCFVLTALPAAAAA